MSIEIDRSAFDSWLAHLHPGKVMGRGACMCPVAEYLAGQGYKHISVSCNSIKTMQTGYCVMPHWVGVFIFQYDEHVKAYGSIGPTTTRALLSRV